MNQKFFISTVLTLLSGIFGCFAQVGIGTLLPDSSSIMDLTSSSKGFLPPRMTAAQRNSIQKPATGLVIFNTTTGCLNIWSGALWRQVCPDCEQKLATPVIKGLDTINCSASSVTYSLQTIAGATKYIWSVPYGAKVTSGQNQDTITVDFANSSGGKLSVVAEGECPNSDTAFFSVAVSPLQRDSAVFSFIGQTHQIFNVPACIDSIHVTLWGAQAGNSSNGSGGEGGFVSADIRVKPNDTLYIYVGEQPANGAGGGWNGGGSGSLPNYASSGGGASDIRTKAGLWNDPAGLQSRITVAAGGGGRSFYDNDKRGGGLNSFGDYPASQASAGQGGGFGYGGSSGNCQCGYYSAGGGGGWYGGGATPSSGMQSGSGGSSYYGGKNVFNGFTSPGGNSGHGRVVISW
jgi:hypothetical protein